VLARNWRCRSGEIDIVAARGNTVVFCEVKTRASDRFGTPAHAVNLDKQRRLRRLAMAWIAEHRWPSSTLRFDVACVVGTADPLAVEVIESAF
jgi:putative endonuclease